MACGSRALLLLALLAVLQHAHAFAVHQGCVLAGSLPFVVEDSAAMTTERCRSAERRGAGTDQRCEVLPASDLPPSPTRRTQEPRRRPACVGVWPDRGHALRARCGAGSGLKPLPPLSPTHPHHRRLLLHTHADPDNGNTTYLSRFGAGDACTRPCSGAPSTVCGGAGQVSLFLDSDPAPTAPPQHDAAPVGCFK